MSAADNDDNNPLLPQYKEVFFDESEPLNEGRTRRPKWKSPKSKNVLVVAGCLFILPIICLLSPLFAFNTLAPRTPEEVHAPKHTFTLTSANPDAGSHTQDHRPWPTNDGFPPEPFRTNLGDIGPTQTGAEAFIVQTAAAYPIETALNPAIVRPTAKDARGPDEFDILRHFGPLTPYTSSPNYLPTTPLTPDTCEIEQVHMIHRHGSRYPTPNSLPLKFSEKLSTAVKANMNSNDAIGFNGELAFLNEWRYALGHSILTPVGRWQLYNSGASFRLKYGHLLNKLTSHKPVFRTTTQDRMFKSAINWLAGFFGVDSWQEESHLSIMHEARGFNNTLAPWETCPREDSYQSARYVRQWRNKYLSDAQKRLNKQAVGYEFDITDVVAMQDLCAYETVSLGYSRFCHLFTKKEWEGYNYAWDLQFYYDAGFGSPTARAQGLGWVQETLARLEQKTPAPYDSTTNSTLDNDPVTFPLDMPIYTDFSHDTVIANIVATLNLTQFAAPLSANKIPRESKHSTRWRTSHIAPFAGNLVLQKIKCHGDDTTANPKDYDAWEITKTHKVPPAAALGDLVQANPLARATAESYAGSKTSISLPTPTADYYSRVFNLDQPYRGTVSDGILPELSIRPLAVEYPYTTDYPSILVRPVAKDAKSIDEFDVIGNWGINMPYKSSPQLLEGTSPFPPQSCRIDSVNLLHRHAERYPSSWDQSLDFAKSLSEKVQRGLNASKPIEFFDELEFLSDYSYPLGSDKLTSIGRDTMFRHGTQFVRTTTEERMYRSATNFLSGLLGEEWPDKIHLVQQIEEDGFNSTLNVWNTCNREDADQGDPRKEHWQKIYLQDASKRLSANVKNANFTVDDVAGMQDLCAYETIALGYSHFCSLFTKDEWKGYGYGYDLYHYGDAGFGGPVARASGLGYLEELLARMTNDRKNLEPYESSTNRTLNQDPITFPTDQAVNIDFTHDVTIGEVVVALNLTHFSRGLSQDYIETAEPRWKSNVISPFAANILIQTISCGEDNKEYARVILNDAVQPLSGFGKCGDNAQGMCELKLFIKALKQAKHETNFTFDCFGDFNNTHVVHNALPEMKTSILIAAVASIASSSPLNQRATAVKAGSATSDQIPWPTDDGLSNDVYKYEQGHRGPTPTGIQPAAIQTAPAGYYPYVKEPNAPVIKPKARDAKTVEEFDVTGKWGVLTPYRSSPVVLEGSSPLAPQGCSIDAINVVHRHGARYPTTDANPAVFAANLTEGVSNSESPVEFNGELEFLADWTYGLGGDILTPIGRTEESDSGSSFRTKYGYLLNKFTKHKPIFRTTTQDRMYNSAIEFISGFFGVSDWQDNAHLVQIIEEKKGGFNNTLNPMQTCKEKEVDIGDDLKKEWYNIYLQDALARINEQTVGYEFTIDDIYAMQDTCAYETVALGYSSFCSLFTKSEWEAYEYASDLTNYGNDSFGNPLAKARGLGWVQELLYRLSGDKSALEKPSTVNTTLDYDERFLPLDQAINIDFSHDVVIANILTALNLTQFATPLKSDAIAPYSKDNLRWVTANNVPFGSNVVIQSLTCSDEAEKAGKFNRIVINDAVHPLTGISGCEQEDKNGFCDSGAFINGLRQLVEDIDYDSVC
ncbi:phosphoglycerate mutase-like protein [Wallemia mellicola]|nr:phosphoglycerate mutase-like protein [Wallemia mellicola]